MGGCVSFGKQKPSVSGAEPEDRKAVSLLGGGAVDLTCKGRATPAPDRARAFRAKPRGEKIPAGRFLRPRFQQIPNHFYQISAFCSVQDRADREGQNL